MALLRHKHPLHSEATDSITLIPAHRKIQLWVMKDWVTSIYKQTHTKVENTWICHVLNVAVLRVNISTTHKMTCYNNERRSLCPVLMMESLDHCKGGLVLSVLIQEYCNNGTRCTVGLTLKHFGEMLLGFIYETLWGLRLEDLHTVQWWTMVQALDCSWSSLLLFHWRALGQFSLERVYSNKHKYF